MLVAGRLPINLCHRVCHQIVFKEWGQGPHFRTGAGVVCLVSVNIDISSDEDELDSFTDVPIDETTESKATNSKIKTEVEPSGSLPALAYDVELDSFTDVAIDETTESKAKKSKIKTEVEENDLLTDCRLFLLIIQLRQSRKFTTNELQICL